MSETAPVSLSPPGEAHGTSVEGTSIYVQRQGMERGYALSPMAQLWLEYGRSTERSTSTSTRVVGFATKQSLKADEVIDQGVAFEMSGRYRLNDRLARTVAQTVEELQTFIMRMAALIPERQHYFLVDPDETLLEVLEGAESPHQLFAAWKALSNRMESAQKFMMKYKDEYTDSAEVNSPASTNQELLQDHKALTTADDRLRQMYDKFPRHNTTLSTADVARLREGKSWNEVVRLPSWLEDTTRQGVCSINKKDMNLILDGK
jgi:hypothetical protein